MMDVVKHLIVVHNIPQTFQRQERRAWHQPYLDDKGITSRDPGLSPSTGVHCNLSFDIEVSQFGGVWNEP